MKSGITNDAQANVLAAAIGFSLSQKVNPKNTASYYYILKGLIGAWLLCLRRAGVDVIVTSETKNVWQDYGKRGRDPATGDPYMKIVAQTAKLWPPWLQHADALFVLDRISGDRHKGEGTLMPYPTASMDTVNTKCSIPGVQPKFAFNNWDVFWDMVKLRRIPTAIDFKRVAIPGAVSSDGDSEVTFEDARAIVVGYAKKLGVAKSAKDLASLGRSNSLDPLNLLMQYNQWIDLIEREANEPS